MSKIIKTSLFFALILFLVGGYYFYNLQNKKNYVTVSEAPRGGDFQLNSLQGPFKLSDLKGKLVVLYFGFTACPDVCPTTLAHLKQAFEKLIPQELEKVQALFIAVDPERDNLQRLQEYVSYFHPQITPLHGSIDEIKKVAMLYGATFTKIELDSAMEYTLDHTASLFVIDPQGIWTDTIPHGTSPEEIALILKKNLHKE